MAAEDIRTKVKDGGSIRTSSGKVDLFRRVVVGSIGEEKDAG